MFSISRIHEVLWAKCVRTPDLDRLVPLRHGIGSDPALTLGRGRPSIEHPGTNHVRVHGHSEVLRQPGCFDNQPTIDIDDLRQLSPIDVIGMFHRFVTSSMTDRNLPFSSAVPTVTRIPAPSTRTI